ncbi:Zinc phosphodiesterase ELAC protein 2 [Actinomortierella ambigua]|nr:Zinc phosphodiesterase ELAC protein 2 [Actinomortierella ambigua]
MKAYLQVLSNGTADCSPSVILHFDSQRYMINCGEGTQRLCMESKLRFSKLKTIFFTRTHWDCAGGVPGMLLTLSDVGVRNIKLIGGENLTHLITSTRHFVYRNTMAVEALELTSQIDNGSSSGNDSQKTTYKDENLRVTAVHVYPEGYERSTEPMPPPRDTFLNRSRSRSRSRTPPNLTQQQMSQHRGNGGAEGGEAGGRPKRPSEDMSPAELAEAAGREEDPATIRRLILADMLNLSRFEAIAAANAAAGIANPATTTGKQQKKQQSGQPKNKRQRNSHGGASTITGSNVKEMDAIEATEKAPFAFATTANPSTCKGGTGPRIIRRPYQDLPRTRPNPAAISYIFQTPDYPGKFNVEEAVRLGVKKGPLFGQLVNGRSVPSTNGGTVHPHQVISGGRPGRVVMVVDCPSVEYIASLVSAPEFQAFQSSSSADSTTEGDVCSVVHMAGETVLSDPAYQQWMASFGNKTQHIVAHQDFCGERLIWRSQSVSAVKLSKLSNTIFPVPYYNNRPVADLASVVALPKSKTTETAMTDKESHKDGTGEQASMVIPSESMLIYHLEPSTGIDRAEVIPPLVLRDHEDDERLVANKEYMREYITLAKQARQEIEAEQSQLAALPIPGREVVMTALGTGSSHPSKYRNVSATLVTMENEKVSSKEQPRQERDRPTFLLDVGEGTYGQMYRHFGGFRRSAEQIVSVDDRIKQLKGIFVSHLHADHHLGIVTVLDRWNKLREPDSNLHLVAPRRFNTFLQELSDVQDFGYDHVRFIDSEAIVYWRSNNDYRRLSSESALNEMLLDTGFSQIDTVDVIHCPWSYGISMTHTDGWKIVYSGDTRPCKNLVEAGMNATVLLHEATFEDDMEDEARIKNHSTTDEAIRVGEGMRAQFTLLTHFSQRYPKIPRFDYQSRQIAVNADNPQAKMPVGLCFDLMSVKLGEIPVLPKFLPALEALYSPQSDEAQEELQLEQEDVELASLSKSSM